MQFACEAVNQLVKQRQQRSYATNNRDIVGKYHATDNVVTKWAYRCILQHRMMDGDKQARMYLASLDTGYTFFRDNTGSYDNPN